MNKIKKLLYLVPLLSLGGVGLLSAQEAAVTAEVAGAAPQAGAANPAEPPAAEKPAEEKPAEEKPAEEKPAVEEKPAEKAEAPAPDAEQQRVAAIRDEISKLSLERELLSARSLHQKEQLAAEQADRRLALEKQKFDMEERTQKLAEGDLRRKELLDGELADLKLEAEKLKAEKEIEAARVEAKLSDLRLAEAEAKVRLSGLMVEIAVREKEQESEYYADKEPQQLDNPLQGNRLVISDRRIELNGPIGSATADYVATRIDFFNNKDAKKPIFIVIDNSPGGSVMSGYKILRAMDGSEAPIYVVVKQFAASMAACIATLADHSVAYPNAIILHHQISAGSMGNLTQQRESLQEMEEWWRRLAEPIAKKMGISRDEFIKRMYERVSSGDWQEFGDQAEKLKWIDHIVDEIHETSQVKSPDARSTVTVVPTPTVVPVRRTTAEAASLEAAIPVQATGMQLYEQIDQDGRPFVRLPRPNPVDFYYMHNPDGYFRFR